MSCKGHDKAGSQHKGYSAIQRMFLLLVWATGTLYMNSEGKHSRELDQIAE